MTSAVPANCYSQHIYKSSFSDALARINGVTIVKQRTQGIGSPIR